MNEFINQLAFGWYPYLAVTVLVVGSIFRFDANQFGWRSQSSQFLRKRQMVIGSNLFHMGILVLLMGHFVGLLTPINVFDALGVSHSFKQTTALVVGGIAGVAAYVGCTLLLHRRLFDGRIRKSSSLGDILVLVLLWLQLTLGILTTFWTIKHLDGSEMVKFMSWANGILTLDPAAPQRLSEVALVYKLHIILGLTLFLITPFTRLVHIWSAPLGFLIRPGYQIVRSRRAGREDRSPTHGPAGVAPSYGGDTVMRTALDEGRAT
ncbi:respiratory nitrate reductase subunit gamma [Sphingomonas sp. RB56-2]|uniref:Respiratory nitrate reductase subunit gamma n=1 Tax=Sphingomonas brevis TaxID=2908206 RepID=A0ABT0S8H8_9SPHN|nr:respiratory nitrate reductase subunit gamma [Sphingomonas brevis]MCL6740694.1 respiratory nitrate reductase subunit gamma [Sphingomonas brevis]